MTCPTWMAHAMLDVGAPTTQAEREESRRFIRNPHGVEPIEVDEPLPPNQRSTVIMAVGAAERLTDRAMIAAIVSDLRDIAYATQPGTGWSRASVEHDLRNVIAKATRYLENK